MTAILMRLINFIYFQPFDKQFSNPRAKARIKKKAT